VTRPDLPATLKRAVLVEAGHRCAIPSCRETTTEIAHIEPWAKVKVHEFANLIALCPNCHTRFDKGEIDKSAMLIYKRKLVFLSDRYSRFEMRVLEHLRNFPRAIAAGVLSVQALLDDGLVEVDMIISDINFDVDEPNDWITASLKLTDAGRLFLNRWASGSSEGLTYEDA
jgi:hypothetical protein